MDIIKNEPLIKKEEEINKSENKPPTVIFIEKERIVTKEVEHQFVTLKFKDNKGNKYEIDADNKRRFNDVLNELIGKYDYLRKREIRSVIYNNRFLYLTSRRCFETIEELRIEDNSDYILINLEEEQRVSIINDFRAFSCNDRGLPTVPFSALHRPVPSPQRRAGLRSDRRRSDHSYGTSQEIRLFQRHHRQGKPSGAEREVRMGLLRADL